MRRLPLTNLLFGLWATACSDPSSGDEPTTTGAEGESESSSETAESETTEGEAGTGDEDGTSGDGVPFPDVGGEGGDTSTLPCSWGLSTLAASNTGLDTTFTTDDIVECAAELTLVPLGAELCLDPTEDGSAWYVTVERVVFEDVPQQSCSGATVGLGDLELINQGDGMDVRVDEDGGAMQGQQVIVLLASANGFVPGAGKLPSTLVLGAPGHLPVGSVEFGADTLTLSYDNQFNTFATIVLDFGVPFSLTFSGLRGDLVFEM